MAALSLKRQLLLVSLLMLLVPLAGVQFALELDNILRQQAQQQLQQQANRLALLTGDELLAQPPLAAGTFAVYTAAQNSALLLDGYADDWPGYESLEPFPPSAQAPLSALQPWQQLPGAAAQPSALYWQASHSDKALYLLIRIPGQPPQLFNPGAPQQAHHRLLLQLFSGANELHINPRNQAWLLRPSAPGRLPARSGANWTKTDPGVNAFWQPVANGWQLELALPRPATGSRITLALYGGEGVAAEHPPLAQIPAATMIRRNGDLEQTLASWLDKGQQLRVMEESGWVIARQQRTAIAATTTDIDQADENASWLQQVGQNLLQALVKANQPDSLLVNEQLWRQLPVNLPAPALVRHGNGSLWLSAQAPVFGGRTLVLEQSLEQLLNISGAALGTVLARSFLIIIGLVVVLLGYASWLSWRISRLAKWVTQCVDADGRMAAQVPLPAKSGIGNDELGQLQQRFNRLVSSLHGYNQYLESFSQRLSHELKTPLAVVRSSLDNLTHCTDEAERQNYLTRAQSAVARLSGILRSMSEATRLEQSLEAEHKEVFDVADVLTQVTAAYQALDPHHVIVYQGPEQGSHVLGSPELLVQLLDKLVDNARDFTPSGQRIELDLRRVDQGWQLSVFNQGSRLPAGADIFSAFVSHRAGELDTPEHHLGQGLLIAQLIANYHLTRLEADNQSRNGLDGVAFQLVIPAVGSGADMNSTTP
ncbi:histidine kinase dimerization/phospho-acceptor domain-containing protein [Marinobacter psychrophilus]|uniref:histidine kinase dimerization/phospho-acceptor domain-containing protein n=1 Tax=Marinobacter psychrophilus TaxID=330734 RepID=UPI001B5CA2F2|nr:histidine kinase dimerization/phospho-acceptor domain-containing protein [Marinobacter psychrophilus]MBQ0764165.1 histidine kinase [Marinobacter psychrophilus]MBQ0844945.1 histidine kinase [Marinobacter psychrophilus]